MNSTLNRFGPEPYTELHRTTVEIAAGELRLVDLSVLWGEGPPERKGMPALETFSIVAVTDTITGDSYLHCLPPSTVEALEYEVWECRRYEDDQFYQNADPWPLSSGVLPAPLH